MSQQSFLVTVSNRETHEAVETWIHEDDQEMDRDSLFWNLVLVIDPKYDINVEYLSRRKTPERFVLERKLG